MFLIVCLALPISLQAEVERESELNLLCSVLLIPVSSRMPEMLEPIVTNPFMNNFELTWVFSRTGFPGFVRCMKY